MAAGHERKTAFVDDAGALHIPSTFSAPSLSPGRTPAASVASGVEVVFHTSDCAYGRLSQAQSGDPPPTMQEINAVTGPLLIEGALPGDALRIEVLDVHIRRCWSVWTADETMSGCLARKLAVTGRTAAVRQLAINDARRTVQISDRLHVPLEPMVQVTPHYVLVQ